MTLPSSFMNKKTFASIFAVLSIVGYGVFVFAVGPFAPGTELDPGCSPYINNDPLQGVDTDCTVVQLLEIERGAGVPGSTPAGSDPILYIDESTGDVYSWDTNQWNVLGGGGSGPFSIVNGNSIFSTGLTGTGDNSNASYAFFTGINAGSNATNASYSNFIGWNSGADATSAYGSNFIGAYAGYNAASAYTSNFIGFESGSGATNAFDSNFFGYVAGKNAINASHSFFAGYQSGFRDNSGTMGSENSANSIFIGRQANHTVNGADLDNTSTNMVDSCNFSECYSILLGNYTDTGGFSNSIAMGAYATNTAANQFMMGSSTRPINDLIISGTGSLFLPVGDDSQRTSYATDGAIRYSSEQGCLEMYASSSWACLGGGSSGPFSIVNGTSIFSTGLTDTGLNSAASDSFFVGDYAGYEATSATQSNFLGIVSGYNATNASNSNFLGSGAGYEATNASNSNFLGYRSGYSATNASSSNFLGFNAGRDATNAYGSNFFGTGSGQDATNAIHSNFLGSNTGTGATNASNSTFLGYSSGNGALNASNSLFIGSNAGLSDTVNNILTVNYSSPSNSFMLGEEVQSSSGGLGIVISDNGGTLEVAVLNSFAFENADTISGSNSGSTATIDSTSGGGTSILIGHNTNTGGFSDSIAMGAFATNTASNQFMIGSSARPINELVIVGNGATCAIDNDIYGNGSTGLNCSSDERLKTNINPLSSTLNNINNIQTVTYNWNANPDSNTQIGFLAQNLQQYYPELIRQGHDGYLQVNYAGMTPILTKAIQELDLKLSIIESQTIQSGGFSLNSLFTSLQEWLGNVGNGIVRLFAKQIVTDELCIGSTCVTESQLIDLLNQNGQVINTQSGNNEPSSVDNSVSLDDQSDESESGNTEDDQVNDVNNEDEIIEQIESFEQENLEESSPSESESSSEESESASGNDESQVEE